MLLHTCLPIPGKLAPFLWKTNPRYILVWSMWQGIFLQLESISSCHCCTSIWAQSVCIRTNGWRSTCGWTLGDGRKMGYLPPPVENGAGPSTTSAAAGSEQAQRWLLPCAWLSPRTSSVCIPLPGPTTIVIFEGKLRKLGAIGLA